MADEEKTEEAAPAEGGKKFQVYGLGIFLSKPQAWHIIRRKAVYHQGRIAPLYLITRQRAFPCGLMIYNASH